MCVVLRKEGQNVIEFFKKKLFDLGSILTPDLHLLLCLCANKVMSSVYFVPVHTEHDVDSSDTLSQWRHIF